MPQSESLEHSAEQIMEIGYKTSFQGLEYDLSSGVRTKVIDQVKTVLDNLSPEIQLTSKEQIAFCQNVLARLKNYEEVLQTHDNRVKESVIKLTLHLEVLIIALALTTFVQTSSIENALGVVASGSVVNFLYLLKRYKEIAGRNRALYEIQEEVNKKMDLLRSQLPVS